MVPDARTDTVELLDALTDLLLRWSYEGTSGAELIIKRVARRYGVDDVDVVFLADAAVVTVGEHTIARSAAPVVPPLHQVSELKRLLATIDEGRLTAEQATRRLADLQLLPTRFGRGWRVLGLALFSVGFGISVQATWQEVVASAVLGLLVGCLVVAVDGRPRLALVAPFAASVAVSALVLVAYRAGWIDGGPIQLIVPALFYFIPGDALSAAMLELVGGRVTAGASRLTSSIASLLMLGFGALVATVLVDVPQGALFDVRVAGNLGPVVVALGWVIFALGVLLTFSMAPGDFGWALSFVLGTAAVTALAGAAAGDEVGTFVGATAMTSAALLLGRRRRFPPPYVLYLGAFYVLTPGSHGLRGIESWIGGHPVRGVASLADMLALLAAIGIGHADRRRRRAPPARGRDLIMYEGSPDPADGQQAFLLELGRMLSLAGTAVTETQERLAARLRTGPPSQVTFLPAFWLLVPGAIGLIGVTEVLGNPAAAGVDALIEPLASIVAITLGVLCGVSTYRGLAAALSGRRARARLLE
nr:hypothetical protein GCM10020092_052860 [Actinoplanes digitatis]